MQFFGRLQCTSRLSLLLGPRCFVSYTEDIVSLLDRHAVRWSHFYADDTQFHDSCQPDDTHSLRARLSRCADDVNTWCESRHHTVDHQILLTILSKRFSMESTTLSWFESYLADRTQLFTHAGRETCSFSVDCSVPQGSLHRNRC